jgi:Holliday junction resolvase RusA-like endonuclease
MTLKTFIPGAPVGKGRPRFQMRPGRNPRVYTPKKTELWETRAAQILRAPRASPMKGPIELEIKAFHKRPKTRPKSIPLDVWKGGRRCHKPTKPDLDNIIKAVGDAIDRAGLFETSDAQIVSIKAEDFYAGLNDAIGVQIQIKGTKPYVSI